VSYLDDECNVLTVCVVFNNYYVFNNFHLLWLMLVVRQQYWMQPKATDIRSVPVLQTIKGWRATGSL